MDAWKSRQVLTQSGQNETERNKLKPWQLISIQTECRQKKSAVLKWGPQVSLHVCSGLHSLKVWS